MTPAKHPFMQDGRAHNPDAKIPRAACEHCFADLTQHYPSGSLLKFRCGNCGTVNTRTRKLALRHATFIAQYKTGIERNV